MTMEEIRRQIQERNQGGQQAGPMGTPGMQGTMNGVRPMGMPGMAPNLIQSPKRLASAFTS